MKRRIRYMALLLVLCMLALTGCAQPRDTMTLRVCLDAAPATLDPAMASSDAERTVVAHLFENLMKLSRGEDGGIQPVYAAAKSYTVEDNLDGTETYTFTLRQNVRWSDGQTVTAHDFVYAWQRLADPATGSPHAALLDMVAGFDQVQAEQDGSLLQVSAPDDFTFVVKLSYKCAYFLTDVCAGTATMPVRSDAAEREDWSLHSETLLTDGPYRATGWDETGLTAQAADGYYDARRLGPDVLEFRFETDGQARADLLSGGDVDFAMNLPEGDTSDPYPQTTLLLLNQRTGSLESESLRRALALTTVTADRGDASGLLSLWESGNGYFYSTAYDMLLRAADASGHVEVRDAYLEDAEAMLVEDGWVIPLYYGHRHSGLAQQLTAPLYDGTGVYRFSAVVRQTPQ